MDLHQAIAKADFLQVRRLVESGADVNSRDKDRRTPLMLCCLHDGEPWALGAARMLLVHGGRVGSRDACGRSALVYAVLYERLGLVQLFLRALDYDLSRVDGRGRTALWYALQLGNAPIRDLLVQTMKRYGLMMDVEAAAASGLGGQDKSGRGRSGAVEQKNRGGAARRKTTGFPSLQPGRDVAPLSRKNLPYKPLPEHLWEKRASFYKALKPRETKPEFKKDSRQVSKKGNGGEVHGGEGGREQGGKEEGEEAGKKEKEGQKTTSSPPQDWKLILSALTQALEHQISPSYRSRAQPRPPAPRPRRRAPRLGPGPTAEALLRQRGRRGRRMSLDAISDSLLKERRAEGAFRRRCSVAVMPMIRMGVLGGRRASSSGLEGWGVGGGGGGGGREGRVIPKPLVKIQEGKKKNLK